MSEQRLIDANESIDTLNEIKDSFWNQGDYSLAGVAAGAISIIDETTTIDSEALPIVQELRAKLARYEQAAAEKIRNLDNFNNSQYAWLFNEVTRLRANLENRWISTKDDMPTDEEPKQVVVSGKYENLTFVDAYMTATCYDGEWFIETYPYWENPNVSYWMDAPLLPACSKKQEAET